jgi:hypothetical protein
MQIGTSRRNCFIDSNDALSELRANSAIHPGGQQRVKVNNDYLLVTLATGVIIGMASAR